MTLDDAAPARRLDVAMVEVGLAPTRSRARDLIARGFVTVDGRPITKPGAAVAVSTRIAISPDAPQFVSRGAEKLQEALHRFGFDAAGRVALDVGASTGGFTEVLLKAGAARVYAADVGHDQLHASLRAHPRVVALERTDARKLTPALVPEPVTAIVADVSFISLTKALSPALALAGRETWLVALIKPQFEAGPDAVGKGGVVGDPADRARAVTTVSDWVAAQSGWDLVGVIPSPIAGSDGNVEFLLGAHYADTSS